MFIVTRKAGQKIIIQEEGRKPIVLTALSNPTSVGMEIGIDADRKVDIILEEKINQPRLSHQYQSLFRKLS